MSDGDRVDDLSLATIEGYDHYPTEQGDWICFKCCIHKGDNQKSLHVHKITGKFHCWNGSCGKWGIVIEKQPEQPAPTQARDSRRSAAPPLPKAEPLTPDPAAVELAKAAYAAFKDSPAQEYAIRRGVPLDLATKTGLGYYAGIVGGIDSEWLTFPLRCPISGKPTGFNARNIRSDDQKQKTRVKGPKGIFGKLPGEPIMPPEVLLVEGPFEAFAVMASPNLPPVRAVIGATHQAALYDDCRLVVIAFDDDDAGDKGTERLVTDLNMRRLRRHEGPRIHRFRRNVLRERYGVKDLGELLQRGIPIALDNIPEWPPNKPQATATSKAATIAQEAATSVPALLEAVYAAIRNGAPTQALTAAIRELLAVCDLPQGYRDPADDFADVALPLLAAELREKARMTPDIQKLLDTAAP